MSQLTITGAGPTNGGGGTFSPSDLANLSLWLRGDDVTLNGSDVSSWNDKSGNGRHYAQATAANQPGYLATGGPNNTPCLEFNGVDKYMDRAGWTETGAATLIMVIKVDSPIPGIAQGTFVISDGTNSSDFELISYAGYTVYNVTLGNASGGSNAFVGYSPINYADFDSIIFTYNGSGSATPTNYAALVDGSSQAISASGLSAAYPASGSVIGRRLDVSIFYFFGKIAEIIFYSDQKTGADLTNLAAYLTARYS